MRFKIRRVNTKLSMIFIASILVSMILSYTMFAVVYNQQMIAVARTSTQETLNSMSQTIQNYFDNLATVTLFPYVNSNIMYVLKKKAANEDDLSEREKYELNSSLRSEFSRYFSVTREDVLDYIMVTENGEIFHSSKKATYIDNEYVFEDQEWFKEIDAANGNVVCVGSHLQDYISYGSGEEVFAVGRVIKNIDNQERLGILIAEAKTSNLRQLLNNIHFQNYAVCVILDSKDQIVCSSGVMNERQKDFLKTFLASGEEDGAGFCAVSSKISWTGWTVVALMDMDQIGYNQYNLLIFVILFLISGALLGFAFFQYLSRIIIRPLHDLTVTSESVKEGNLSVRYEVSSSDEIGQLGESLNTMIDQLIYLIESEKNSVALQKKAEFYALQSQIEPHFIYNVLNNFQGLNQAGEKQLLDRSIHEFAELLRYMLNQSDAVPLSSEIEMLEKYSDLNKLRYGSRLETIFSCDDDVKNVMIPKLLLQPLVENAIYHGIESKPEGGYVSIICERNEGEFQITVEDNGVGFDERMAYADTSVGLKNVRERLLIYYKDAAFEIHSLPGQGTLITITIAEKDLKYADINSR